MRLPTATKIAIARVLRRLVAVARALTGRRGSEVVCRRRGVVWSLDLDEGVQLALYLGLYERGTTALLKRLCPADGVALDVGANIGAQALPLAATLSAGGLVVAVEPTDHAYERLRRNLSLNGGLADRVRSLHLALTAAGERPAGSYFASWPLGAASGLHPVHGGAPQAASGKGMTLDALVQDLGLGRLDLIKLDVDGHELPVLLGARETLVRLRPAVVFEFCPYLLAEAGESPHTLLSLFDDAGYTLHDEEGLAPIGDRERMIRSIPDGGGINLVALPR
jgi:FkbM family methyltransferase